MRPLMRFFKPLLSRCSSRRLPTAGATDAEPKHAGGARRPIFDLLRNARGSIFVFMAVAMLALGTATGVGIDFARGLNFKSDLQGAVDAAAIAGASVYFNAG